jgi:hypothetical protein
MTPEEYLEKCIEPGIIPGYAFCQIDLAAKKYGWTLDRVAALKQTVESRYREQAIFPFPKKVRYV